MWSRNCRTRRCYFGYQKIYEVLWNSVNVCDLGFTHAQISLFLTFFVVMSSNMRWEGGCNLQALSVTHFQLLLLLLLLSLSPVKTSQQCCLFHLKYTWPHNPNSQTHNVAGYGPIFLVNSHLMFNFDQAALLRFALVKMPGTGFQRNISGGGDFKVKISDKAEMPTRLGGLVSGHWWNE